MYSEQVCLRSPLSGQCPHRIPGGSQLVLNHAGRSWQNRPDPRTSTQRSGTTVGVAGDPCGRDRNARTRGGHPPHVERPGPRYTRAGPLALYGEVDGEQDRVVSLRAPSVQCEGSNVNEYYSRKPPRVITPTDAPSP